MGLGGYGLSQVDLKDCVCVSACVCVQDCVCVCMHVSICSVDARVYHYRL